MFLAPSEASYSYGASMSKFSRDTAPLFEGGLCCPPLSLPRKQTTPHDEDKATHADESVCAKRTAECVYVGVYVRCVTEFQRHHCPHTCSKRLNTAMLEVLPPPPPQQPELRLLSSRKPGQKQVVSMSVRKSNDGDQNIGCIVIMIESCIVCKNE